MSVLPTQRLRDDAARLANRAALYRSCGEHTLMNECHAAARGLLDAARAIDAVHAAEKSSWVRVAA